MKQSFLRNILLVTFLIVIALPGWAQNYSSVNDGLWTTNANWSNTSGFGNAGPATDGSHTSGTITMQHNLTLNANYSFRAGQLNIGAGKTLQINGTFSVTSGALVNVYGTLNILGSVTLSSNFIVHPGARVVVGGSVTVTNSNYLNVGTSVAPPPYADMVINQNLVSTNSGDVTVHRNGRLAVFGNISATGGGTILTINNGGQAFVNGNISFTGGGSNISNNNSTSPFGLYVGGTISNTGGGSSSTTNLGDENVLQSTNPDFFNWVATQPNSPLPVTLLYFKAEVVKTVVLTWATASEINFDYFRLERSKDGIIFTEYARIQGQGTHNQLTNYSFEDAEPWIGKSYYRLTSVDVDGYTEMFPVLLVVFEQPREVKVFPNPVVNQKLMIQFNFSDDESMEATITDVHGIVVSRFELVDSFSELAVPLQTGTYVLRISGKEFVRMVRIIIP